MMCGVFGVVLLFVGSLCLTHGYVPDSTSFAVAPLPNSVESSYGVINVEHLINGIVLPNYEKGSDVQLHYALNNLPATEHLALTRLTLLFDVNPSPRSGSPADLPHSLSIHIARPLETPVLDVTEPSRTVMYIKSVTIPDIQSNVEIDLKPYGLVLEVNDLIVMSSPNDAILLRAGVNQQGRPVPVGVIEVSQGEQDQHVKTLTILDTTQEIQLCTSYGAVNLYDLWSEWPTNFSVFSSEARQIQPSDGNVHQITVGFFFSKLINPLLYDRNASIHAQVQVVFARPIASDLSPSQGYHLDVLRAPQLYNVTNNVPFDLPTSILVHKGEIVGCRLATPNVHLHMSAGSESSYPLQASQIIGRSGVLFAGPGSAQDAVLDESVNNYRVDPPPILLVQNAFQYLVSPIDATTEGDPQFAGFQGQTFQFHGEPDEHFNLISSPQLQVNSHFVYLSSGKCDFNDTQCFQHPGTYINKLGFTIPSEEQQDVRIKLVAGSHHQGLRMWISQNETDEFEEITMGQASSKLSWMDDQGQDAKVTYNKFGQVTIDTPSFHIKVVNSEYFFNVGFSLLDRHMLRVGAKKHTISDRTICQHDEKLRYDHGMVEALLLKQYNVQYSLHGLVGQTWRNVMVCGKPWMGSVQDYIVSDLFGYDYYYNFYKNNNNNNNIKQQ